MKTIKAFMIAGIMSFTFAISAHAQEAPPNCEIGDEVGMFEGYLDCALGCIEKAGPWTLRRTFCAMDCYANLLLDINEFMEQTRLF